MNLREEFDVVKNLGSYVNLRKRPEDITDVGLLEKGIVYMEEALKVTGKEYVFKEIQQLSIGSFMRLYPKEHTINTRVNWVIGTYDKEYLMKRIKELKGE